MLKKIALKALSSTTAAIFLLSLMLQAPIANAIPPSISLLIDGTPVTTESITQTVGSTTNIEIRAQGSVLVPIIERPD
jgi:hypothetical protein